MSAALDLFAPATLTHDAGGVRTRLPPGVEASAIYGGLNDCKRYWLTWRWDVSKPCLAAGMMNPSCASETCGDRTVAWVHRWACTHGFGRLIVVNSIAYRAADQAALIGCCGTDPENDQHILKAGRLADMMVLGYGQPRVKDARVAGPRMAGLLRDAGVVLRVWGLSIGGAPKHPLYLPRNTPAVLWEGS